MGGTKPVRVIAMWKKRTEKPDSWHEGTRRNVNYVLDEDAGVSGIQNLLDIDNIPHDTTDELIDAAIISVDANGNSKNPRLLEFDADTVSTTGLVDASTTSLPISAPTNAADFANNKFIKVEDEIMQITGGGGITAPGTLTVRRGEHGSDAATHASSTTVYRVGFNVPVTEITLAGDAVVIAAPVIALTEELRSFYLSITAPTDPLSRASYFKIYRDTSANPTTLIDTVSASGNSQVSIQKLKNTDDLSVEYFFRAKTVTKSGIESGYSNEVSGFVRDGRH